MKLFTSLEKYQKSTHFLTSNEFKFYSDNISIIEPIEKYKSVAFKNEPFLVLRGNIIIRALKNKEIIENIVQEAIKYSIELKSQYDEVYVRNYVNERTKNLPKIVEGDKKIYVPVFTRTTNLIYSGDYSKLSISPYDQLRKNFYENVIDPFEAYNFALYNSEFTSLRFIKSNGKLIAMYDDINKSIYFINNQGRLETKICLFDRYLDNENLENIIERAIPVVDAYFEGNKLLLMNELVNQKFISSKLIHKILDKEAEVSFKLNEKVK